MDYINAATTGTLSPYILPIMNLKMMLSHIEETLPSTLHLPVSSDDTLHFYQYLCTHVLITDKQFLLLIYVPIQDRTQQHSIYKILTLDILNGNFTAGYDKYLKERCTLVNIVFPSVNVQVQQQGAWKQHPCNSNASITFIFFVSLVFYSLFYFYSLIILYSL